MASRSFVLLFVVGLVCTTTCLPFDQLQYADLLDNTIVLQPDTADRLQADTLDREERAVYSGSGEVPTEVLTDDEDILLQDKPEILKLAVNSMVTSRFASTEVRSKLKNLASKAAEASFTLILPQDAFISAFSMTIEGVVYHSEVKPKEEAQKAYNEAKAKGQTAGQVKQSSPEESKFQVSVTVAAKTSVLFNLTYQELLKRKEGMFEHRINIQPGQVVPDVRVEVHLTEPQGLKEVNASWTVLDKDDQLKLNNATMVDMQARTAKVLFDTKGEGLLLTSANGIMGEFVVKYDVVHDLKAGHIEVVNGYFVHYFSPEGLPKTRKNVVFVIDTSGSMQGRKIDQTKAAFKTILDDVRDIDRINIVLFESDITVWRPEEMVLADPDSIQEAKRYVSRIRASGGTNLYDGLMRAADLLAEHGSEEAMPLIIMLTDGQPTSGAVTNPKEIISRVTATIGGALSLFSVGFGNGVDFNFLEKLSLSNHALARKIYEDSSASLQMKGFYDEVANPLLFNIDIQYNKRLVDENSLTKSDFMAYFDGTELTVAGKLKDDVINAVWNPPGKSENRDESSLLTNQTVLAAAQNPQTISIVDGNESSDLELNVVITAQSLDVTLQLNTSTPIEKERSMRRHEVDDFAQRLWAYLTIKNLLEQKKTVNNRQEKDALTDKALNLSLKYHFVTPLTSLLVVKPDEDPVVEAPVELERESEMEDVLSDPSLQMHAAPNYPTGSRGQTQPRRPMKSLPVMPTANSGMPRPTMIPTSFADSDPHFMVRLPQSNVSVCFDVNGDPGDVFNLFVDDKLGLSVNAYVIPANHLTVSGHVATYFGQISVLLGPDHNLLFTKDSIVVDRDEFRLGWEDDLAMTVGEFVVALTGKRRVIIAHGDDVMLVVMLHRVRHVHEFGDETAPNHRIDHLGFYVEEAKGLSEGVHGLIGQFHVKKEVLVSVPAMNTVDPLNSMISEGVNATLFIDGRSVAVTRKSRRIPLVRDWKQCWFAADNGKGLIEGDYADYKRPHLMAHPAARVGAKD